MPGVASAASSIPARALPRIVVLAVATSIALLAGCDDDSGDTATPPTTATRPEPTRTDPAEDPADPCSLASSAAVSDVLGMPVSEGQESASLALGQVLGRGCAYGAVDASSGTRTSATIWSLSPASPEVIRDAFAEEYELASADVEGLPSTSFVTSEVDVSTVWISQAASPFGVSIAETSEDGFFRDGLDQSIALAGLVFEEQRSS